MPTIKVTRRLSLHGNSIAVALPRFMVDALGWKPKETELQVSLTDEGLDVRRADTDSASNKPKK